MIIIVVFRLKKETLWTLSTRGPLSADQPPDIKVYPPHATHSTHTHTQKGLIKDPEYIECTTTSTIETYNKRGSNINYVRLPIGITSWAPHLKWGRWRIANRVTRRKNGLDPFFDAMIHPFFMWSDPISNQIINDAISGENQQVHFIQ
jgi:hypothetical protein